MMFIIILFFFYLLGSGIIYEAILKEGQEPVAEKTGKSRSKKKGGDDEEEGGTVGSVAGGGRYDNLVGMFDAKKRTVPCVGVSFGIERLFAIQERRIRQTGAKVSSAQLFILLLYYYFNQA